MNDLDYPLLHYQDLMLALLKVGSDGPGTMEDCLDHLRGRRELAHEEARVPRADLLERLERARRYLVAAVLIEDLGEGRFRITERGRRALAEHPLGVDDSVLMEFPEFRAFVRESAEAGERAEPRSAEYDQGYRAYHGGVGPSANPYDFDTVKHLAWENGWFQARDEDMARRPP